MAETLVIGVTGPRSGIPWAWWATRWQLTRLGVIPVRLFAGCDRLPSNLSGLIIGGGNDIDPAVYGGDVSSSPHVDRDRDAYELDVLARVDNLSVPILGICRGAQLINIYHGGTLIGDLAAHRKLTSNRGTLLPRKRIAIEPGSVLAGWLDATEIRVNSLHHQAVERTGTRLQVSATDADGIVQAIESIDEPLHLGVQWHPEYLPQRRDHRRLFAAFVTACRAQRARGSQRQTP